jgi:hypothetical protein
MEIAILADIPKLIENGVITHALVIAVFNWYFANIGPKNSSDIIELQNAN